MADNLAMMLVMCSSAICDLRLVSVSPQRGVSASVWLFVATSCRGVCDLMRVISSSKALLNLWLDIMGNEDAMGSYGWSNFVTRSSIEVSKPVSVSSFINLEASLSGTGSTKRNSLTYGYEG